jgi:hypothetical protein
VSLLQNYSDMLAPDDAISRASRRVRPRVRRSFRERQAKLDLGGDRRKALGKPDAVRSPVPVTGREPAQRSDAGRSRQRLARRPESAQATARCAAVPSCRRAVVPSCRRAVVPSCRRAVVPSCRRAVVPSCRRAVDERVALKGDRGAERVNAGNADLPSTADADESSASTISRASPVPSADRRAGARRLWRTEVQEWGCSASNLVLMEMEWWSGREAGRRAGAPLSLARRLSRPVKNRRQPITRGRRRSCPGCHPAAAFRAGSG